MRLFSLPLALAAFALLAVAQDDSVEPAALEPTRILDAHDNPIDQLAASADGAVLISAAKGQIHAWRVGDGEALWKRRASGQVPIAGLAIGGELFAYGLGPVAVTFCRLRDGDEHDSLGGTTVMQMSRCMVLDPKDRWVWLGTDRGVLTRLIPKQVSSYSNRDLKNGGVTCLAMDDAAKLLVAGGADGTLRYVNPQSANVDDRRVTEAHKGPVTAVAIDRKGTLIVSGSGAGDLRTWRAGNGRPRDVLRESGVGIARLAIDSKGARLAVGDTQGRVEIWDLKKGERTGVLAPVGTGAVTGLVFVGKDDVLAVSRADTRLSIFQ